MHPEVLAEVLNVKEADALDVLAYVVFDTSPCYPDRIVCNVFCIVKEKLVWSGFAPDKRTVIEALLDKYGLNGVNEITNPHIFRLPPFKAMGELSGVVQRFGRRRRSAPNHSRGPTETVSNRNVPAARLNENLSNEMWRACDIMRRDNNVGGVVAYTEHLAWLLFLKVLDLEEKKRASEAAFSTQDLSPRLARRSSLGRLGRRRCPEEVEFRQGRDGLIRSCGGVCCPLASLSGTPLAQTIAQIFSDESTGDQTVWYVTCQSAR